MVQQHLRSQDPVLSVHSGEGKLRRIPPRRNSIRYAKTSHPSIRAHFTTRLGVVIVLFFKCMAALLDPAHRRREGIKWGLVTYTMAIFSFVTIFTAMNLNVQSVSYIDNREYPGDNGFLPGPLGYQLLIGTNIISIIPTIAFLFNYWLADGFLVGSLFDASSRCLTLASPPALPLLRGLCHEPLGNRISLPHVPCLYRCAYQFSTADPLV